MKGFNMPLMNLFGKTSIAPVSKKTDIAAIEADGDIVIHDGKALSHRPNTTIQVRTKSLKIDGKVYDVDPKQLIRMIKQVTQTIGEYKERDNPYSGYVMGALRKARSDMVSDLEHHFRIHWEIDESTGRSIFYI